MLLKFALVTLSLKKNRHKAKGPMRKILCSALISLLCSAAFAQRIAVIEFNAGVGISQADVDGISAIFITYFRPAGYTMVERTQIDRVIDEQGLQRSSLTESQMVSIGKILNVSMIVVGDVNVVMGQYNVDVRVLNVESGTIAATEGATFAGTSYRTSMQSIAQKLASKIAISAGPSVSAGSGSSTPRKRTTVETIYGYLKVFPSELGTFDAEPTSVIGHINTAAQYGYNTWRIPTNEELSLLRANGYLNANNAYMTRENRKGVVLLVTDKEDAATLNEQKRQEQAAIARRIEEQRKVEEQRKKELLAQGWIDLGLPSGTLWKNKNESSFYTYEQAITRYGSQLPTQSQIVELVQKCSWVWDNTGYTITGPNGNCIFLPAPAPRLGSIVNGDGYGHYVTSTYAGTAEDGGFKVYFLLYFSEDFIKTDAYYVSERYMHMVRLVR